MTNKLNLTRKEILIILIGLEHSIDYENEQEKYLKEHNKKIEKLINKIKNHAQEIGRRNK